MNRPNIILTGFMGTGKTTVGRLLARALGYDWVDTDLLIEAREGCRVQQIFAERGEAAFRRIEAEVARELAGGRGRVIATGGRMLLDADNARVLGRTGRVFCLTAPPEEILARVTGPGQPRRPLLETDAPLERIMALLAQRAAGYARFERIDTGGKTPEAVCREIRAALAAVCG